MADPQDPPHSEADDAKSTPPADSPPAKAVKKTAKAPAKKAPAKKAAAKKAPAKKAAAKKPGKLAETNGQLSEAAKDVAAQAKSAVEGANNPLPPVAPIPASSQSRVPQLVALTLSLLAILLVRRLRRR
jgi:hypothetical protein